jgi:murein DD-endopeptidase MepM/ murein hydrolase activator NlpD
LGVITSSYGWRSSGYHHGLDIAAEAGTAIKACASGEVVFTGYKSVYGRTVIIQHRDGKQSLYAHTQKVYVKTGEEVVKGQTIATVGTTGRTTGPHLHLEIKQNGKTLNPAQYLKR